MYARAERKRGDFKGEKKRTKAVSAAKMLCKNDALERERQKVQKNATRAARIFRSTPSRVNARIFIGISRRIVPRYFWPTFCTAADIIKRYASAFIANNKLLDVWILIDGIRQATLNVRASRATWIFILNNYIRRAHKLFFFTCTLCAIRTGEWSRFAHTATCDEGRNTWDGYKQRFQDIRARDNYTFTPKLKWYLDRALLRIHDTCEAIQFFSRRKAKSVWQRVYRR